MKKLCFICYLAFALITACNSSVQNKNRLASNTTTPDSITTNNVQSNTIVMQQQQQQQYSGGTSNMADRKIEDVDTNIKEVGKKPRNNKTDVQVALLLDTSNSMDGLIDQAKSQLWKMVNELALAKDEEGRVPNLEIALYHYGNDNLSARGGYVEKVVDFSTDLDNISGKLFALKTNGGEEYCGHVEWRCLKELAWADEPNDLRLIFIAGNEPFTQGPTDYLKACALAVEKGVIINTIHCGNYEEGVSGSWQNGATCSKGKYMNINQDRKIVHIDAPQDNDIEQLNKDLNDTYIGYGSHGKERKAYQMEQDANAASYGKANAAQRAVSKSKSMYKNSDWDLIDAQEEKAVDIKNMKKEDLPKEMQEMSPVQREEYVKKMQEKRKTIQNKINGLNIERSKYVQIKEAEMNKTGDNTLDKVMIEAIREQAKAKKMKFEEK